MNFGLRDQHTEMVLHQSYCCEFKYSEKQIGFIYRNLYNLAFKLFARENVAFLTKQDFLFHFQCGSKLFRIERASNRGKCGAISTLNLASAAGNPGWSRTRPKLVCCEAWWLRSNNAIKLRYATIWNC